jgi:hypothetical protein
MPRKLTLLTSALAFAVPAFCQLTTEQKVQDFRSLAALYAKRYGPANWKQEALGVNVFDIRPWIQRVQSTSDDLSYYEILHEYVASFEDGHSRYTGPSNFVANLGLFADIYDGKVLIDGINRTRYPSAQYPFQIGDEIVSMDGKLASDLLGEMMRLRKVGTERGSRRFAADMLVFRPQSSYPKAATMPDTSQVAIRRADGTVETYELTWLKQGVPMTGASPVPTPFFAARHAVHTGDPLRFLEELQTWRVDPSLLSQIDRTVTDEDGNETNKLFIMGWGTRAPYYTLPSGFVLRRGQAPTDTFTSGTYMAGGRRIGLLRIPNFGPANPTAALMELAGEIAFFQANTDGLVVDVSRNTGGGCIGINYLSYLIPRTFTTFRELYRPTQSLLNSFELSLRNARLQNQPAWVISTLEFYYNALADAAKSNRAMTGPLAAACVSPGYAIPIETAEPARAADGTLLAYTKPIIVLTDELSVSFGDMFPAMLQDNGRGKLVGMRTGGWGGSTSGRAATSQRASQAIRTRW